MYLQNMGAQDLDLKTSKNKNQKQIYICSKCIMYMYLIIIRLYECANHTIYILDINNGMLYKLNFITNAYGSLSQ